MSYLRYDTPIPNPLPSHVAYDVLLEPADLHAALAEHGLITADHAVQPDPSGANRLLISRRDDPSTPVAVTTSEALGIASEPSPSCPRDAAVHSAICAWLDDASPYARPDLHRCNKATTADIVRWLFHGETGLSSKAIAYATFTMQPPPQPSRPPADAGDFGRCLKLIDTIPRASDGLDVMARHDPRWDFLRDHWSMLTQLYESGHPANLRAVSSIIRQRWLRSPGHT